MSPQRVHELLPAIVVRDGRAALAAEIDRALKSEERHRYNQYAWEGSFFLLALALCIAVIARALRAEARVHEEQESFLALVSHQFKTPLASLQLSLETLALRAPPPQGARTLIERMLADLARMELMVTQILESARLERGRVELRPEALPLAAAVARVLAQLEERARQERIVLKCDIAAGLCVQSDPLALDVVLRNVLENALAAVQAAGGGRIEVQARAANGEVQLTVRDSGVGFRPADGARLFEKFTRLHGRRRPLRHRSRTLHRPPHDAARPRSRQRAQRGSRTGGAARAHLAGGARGTGGGCAGEHVVSAPMPAAAHVLVVEDDPHLAAGVMENLRAEGYEVSTAADGMQALEWLAAHACELIVLDVMLPGMDGFGVCRTLREQGNTTPVLFLTARGDPADRVRGLEAGGDDYLAKPFHLQEFLLRVRAILRRWDWYRSASATAATAVLRFGGNEVDFRAFRARSWNGEAQELTEKEAMILKVLAEHAGEIVSREDLLERVWGYDVFPSTRTVDNFILRLRKRFEKDPANPRHFLTVWGVGYRFLGEGGP